MIAEDRAIFAHPCGRAGTESFGMSKPAIGNNISFEDIKYSPHNRDVGIVELPVTV